MEEIQIDKPQARRYSEEEVQGLLRESARIGAQEALASYKKQYNNSDGDKDNEEDSPPVVNPKVVKQLKDTVAVFTALKELSSNPLQKVIEETVGLQATNVVANAFAPRQNQSRDLLDTVLNSQFMYGLGTGLGNRGPELVESMGRTFGNEKALGLINDAIQLSKTGVDKAKNVTPSPAPVQAQKQIQSPPPTQTQVPPANTGSKGSTKASDEDRELLMSLNPNNPDDIAAYAETQAEVPIEAAKQMLILHQQGFLTQMKNEGKDISKYYVNPIKKIDTKLKMKPVYGIK